LFGSSPLTCLAWEALAVAYATTSIALGHRDYTLLYLRISFGAAENPTLSTGTAVLVVCNIYMEELRNIMYVLSQDDQCFSLDSNSASQTRCLLCVKNGGTWSREFSDHVTVCIRLLPVCIYRCFRVFVRIRIYGGNTGFLLAGCRHRC
jgi:hypothetical protein